jgi:uncharacterized protein with PIN domain
MAKHCNNCRSKNLTALQENFVLCLDCGHSISNLSKADAKTKLSSEVKKSKQKQAFAQEMQRLQEEQTKKRYLHFQFRVI